MTKGVRTTIPLSDSWTVSREPATHSGAGIDVNEVPATVPGSVHTDLLAAGLIADPYIGDNERLTDWIGRSNWIYRCELPAVTAENERVELHFQGLDTFAEVRVNGTVVGQTTSMFTSLRIDVTNKLTGNADLLEVRFESPYARALARCDEIGPLPNPYDEPYPFIRKTASNFGWDWGPTLVTAGIWKPVAIEIWSAARIGTVAPTITVEDGVGAVAAQVELLRQPGADSAGLSLLLEIGESVLSLPVNDVENVVTVRAEVASPELWWPRGYGEAARYDLAITLVDRSGRPIDRWERKIGFRTVEIESEPDTEGSPFTIVVNGVCVFARGVNWIPDDCFPTRVGRREYRERLEQAAAANVNFVRVWGGGNYEAEEFYDIADQLGLLVAQDFLFACAAYPETPELIGEVDSEVRENVVRLASHPSLALWFGGNETLWGFQDWEWKPVLGDRDWGERYWMELLPQWLGELDPTRPYWPNSPYSGSPDVHPNDPAHGTSHAWEVWNSEDYLAYRDLRPRFVAEFGYQAPAAYRTLLDSVGEAELELLHSAALQHHQKAADGELKLQRGLDAHFGDLDAFDDWLFATQLNQARAISTGIEHFRSLAPLCAGTVLWQLNDCWPTLSWSVIDSASRLKPSWYALRNAYADRLLTVQPLDEALQLVAINERDEPWHASTSVRRMSFNGVESATQHVEFTVEARSVVRLALEPTVSEAVNPARELIVADADGCRATWYFDADKNLEYPEPVYSAAVIAEPNGYRIDIEAKSLLRDLSLFADRIDPAAVADDMLLTLLPGERASISVTTEFSGNPDRFTRSPQLRCANDLRSK